MKKNLMNHLVVFVLCSVGAQNLNAEAATGIPDVSLSLDNSFQAGRYEASLAGGAMFSPFVATHDRPTINYTFSQVQLGYMLDDVRDRGPFRGNFEVAGQAFGGAVFEGYGSYISGLTIWGRYNIVPRNWRVTPYAQMGAGLTFADIDHHLVGQVFNFNLDLGVGLRCFVTQRWSVNLEYRYQHISNANLSRHNLGVNAQGALLGFSRFF